MHEQKHVDVEEYVSLEKFEKYKEELIRLRRHFHRHPELGLQEFETSAFIQEYLGKLGYRFRIVEPTGIIAEHPCQDEAAFAGKKPKYPPQTSQADS